MKRAMPKTIKLVYRTPDWSLLIDGQEFPFMVAGEEYAPRICPVDYSHVPGVTITVLAERVEVVHEIPAESDPETDPEHGVHQPDGTLSNPPFGRVMREK